MYAGSRGFNTFFEHSDMDYFGVYISDDVDHSKPIPKGTPILTDHDPDIVLYEVLQFCDGLKQGQPLLVSSLFANKSVSWCSDEWLLLVRSRDIFINRQTLTGFAGYIENQMKIMRSRVTKYSKPLYHAYRLYFEMESLLNDSTLIVYFEGEKRQFLLDIRMQMKTRESYLKMLLENLSTLEKSDAFRKLQLRSDWTDLENWRIEISHK
jgi:hypothetical protein